MKTTNAVPPQKTLLALLFSLALSAGPAGAEIVLVEARVTGGAGSTAEPGTTPHPPYQETAGSWSGSSAHTTATGTSTGIGSRFGFSASPILTITPTLIPGNTYVVEVSHVGANASTNLVVNVTYSGCTGTATNTTAFSSAVASPNWERVGMITVDEGVTQPSIIFSYASGTLASTGGRWYSDAFRFINTADACVIALPELTTVNGPLAAGQTVVNVPGVNAAATAVSVYANGALIGRKTNGVAAGVNAVEVTPLVKGEIITVTQSNAEGIESCRPTAGVPVGGGANPPLRVALSVRQNTALTGPIGANGGAGSTIIKFLGATNLVAGAGTAHRGGKLVTPGSEWQTVTFFRGPDSANPTDSSVLWNGADATNPNELKGDFGVLESLAFTLDPDQPDPGPFAIYLDNLMNGETLINDFESANVGAAAVQFNQPSFSGTTTPFLLSPTPGAISPNISVVTNNTSDTGAQSLFVSWQFKDAAAVNWLRLVGQGSGAPNAQLDLRLPITIRMLVLPVGQTPPLIAPQVFADPADVNVLQNGSATFRVTFRGTGPLNYQWRFNGTDIAGATSSTLTLTNIQPSQSGNYSVRISNAQGTAISGDGVLTVVPLIQTPVLTPLWSLGPTARPYLTNDNNTRGLAYHPVSGNLLLVSRTGSNAIHVLDGATGNYLHSLNVDPTVITGGTLALNLIGVAPDGLVFACNLTENGSTSPLRIYQWLDDTPESAPILAWEGDPGSGTPNRWGDTFAVRGSGADHEILLGSRSGNQVAVIKPDFAQFFTINVDQAAAGNFGLGLAFGVGETFWGKGPGLPLVHVAYQLGSPNGAVLQAFNSLPHVTVIGTGTAQDLSLLAGISIESPDNLRLLDISNLESEPVLLDIEFFPTDNANVNGTGSVAFAPDKVFALNSNNGLIAMALDATCPPDRLTVTRTAAGVTLDWTRANSRLQGATQLPAAEEDWTPIPGVRQANLPADLPQRFFRLICP